MNFSPLAIAASQKLDLIHMVGLPIGAQFTIYTPNGYIKDTYTRIARDQWRSSDGRLWSLAELGFNHLRQAGFKIGCLSA